MRSKVYAVITLRTDQGTEYESMEIKSYLNMNGVENFITGRGVYTQMNVEERMNRTITEMERTILNYAGLKNVGGAIQSSMQQLLETDQHRHF